MRQFFTNKFIFLAILLTLFAKFAHGADTIINTDITKVGRKVSSGDKKLEFDTNSGANNPSITTTPANNDLRLKTNKLKVGTGLAVDQTIEFNQGSVPPPAIKWNNTAAKLEFTNDGTNFKGIGSGSGGGSGLNLIENSGFEDGTLGFTSSGGTVAVVTAGSNLLANLKSVTFDASAGSQYFESTAIAVPEFLKGRNCLARVHYKGGDANLKFQILDSSNVAVGPENIFSASTVVKPMQQSFICPTSGSIKWRVVSTADAALIALDQVHLGENDQLVQLSQANHMGTLKYAKTANCTWAITGSGSYQSFSADTDCPTPTVTDKLTAPATKIPGFQMDVVAGNTYRITAKGSFINDTPAQNLIGNWRVFDGTTGSEFMGGGYAFSGDTYNTIQTNLTAIYRPTSSGLKTIQLQEKDADVSIRAGTGGGDADLIFEVEQYPTQTQLALNSTNSNFGWLDGGAVTITGTTTNPTKGTVSTDKFWYKKQGEDGIFRLEFQTTVAGSTGSGDYLFALPAGLSMDSSKVTFYSTVIGNSAAYNMNGGLGSCSASTPDAASSLVGIIIAYDATHVRCVGTDQTQPGAIGSGFYHQGLRTSYMFNFRAPISGWQESSANMPVCVGCLGTGSAGNTRMEYASVSSAGIVSNESSDWISGNASLSDTSLYAFTLNAGAFSANPICFGTTNSTGSFDAYAVIDTASPTSITVRTGNHLPGTAQVKVAREFSLLCIGPK